MSAVPRPSPPPRSGAPLALVNARVIDPATDRDGPGGVLLGDGLIRGVGADVTRDNLPNGTLIVDCGGDVVAPGLVDMHAFVGEPGAEYRETIATATAAAAAGGVTSILALPNTNPPIDDPAVVDFLMRRARDTGQVRILPCAALTRSLAGEDLTEIGLLLQAGAIAFSDGSRSLAQRPHPAPGHDSTRATSMRSSSTSPRITTWRERGVMNEGELATRLGLPGSRARRKAIILERDMRLVALTGARYHAPLIVDAQLNRRSSLAPRRAGCPSPAAPPINHLTLNEIDIGDYRTFLKLTPPLRGEEDRLALVEGVAAGVIDVIVSDHDPQDVEVKRLPFGEAEAGAIGLETMLPAALRLVAGGDVTLPRLLGALIDATGGHPAPAARQAEGRGARRPRPLRPAGAVRRGRGPSTLALQEHTI